MPEGPEIRRAADRVAEAIQGKVARSVWFAFERLKPHEEALTGRKVEEVTSRGKALLTRFAGGLTIYSHNQLYGRGYLVDRGEEPETQRTLRLAIETDDRRALLYSASDIEVLDAEGERNHPFLAKLGPDLLSESTSADSLATRLTEPEHRGRQLGALLLDQAFVAGLGNYLRAEILFEAGIHPRRRAKDLDDEALDRLAERMVALTRRAYETGGIVLPDERVAALRAEGASREASRFWAYGRSGEACRQCGASIRAESVGGRDCFWCPDCQSR